MQPHHANTEVQTEACGSSQAVWRARQWAGDAAPYLRRRETGGKSCSTHSEGTGGAYAGMPTIHGSIGPSGAAKRSRLHRCRLSKRAAIQVQLPASCRRAGGAACCNSSSQFLLLGAGRHTCSGAPIGQRRTLPAPKQAKIGGHRVPRLANLLLASQRQAWRPRLRACFLTS